LLPPAAGIVAGLAARPVLTNLLAGAQIAMTQPIRINDSVIEGEWGNVEEIIFSYVVLRLWNLRRMLPISEPRELRSARSR
jgi:small-conductance mechanosensitive channel